MEERENLQHEGSPIWNQNGPECAKDSIDLLKAAM